MTTPRRTVRALAMPASPSSPPGPERVERAGGGGRCPGEDNHDLAHDAVEGQDEQGAAVRRARAGQTPSEQARELDRLPPVDSEPYHKSNHEHRKERVGVGYRADERDDLLGKARAGEPHGDEHDIAVERDGREERACEDPQAVAESVVVGPEHERSNERPGAARSHEGVAGVEQAGGDDAGGGKNAWSEGEGEAPDVETADVGLLEDALLEGARAVDDIGGEERDHVGEEADDDEPEQLRAELGGLEGAHDAQGA